jgi:serine/threonine-protein kinase
VLSRVIESRGIGAGVGDGAAQVSFADNGTAVVLHGASTGTESRLVMVDRTGREISSFPEKREYRSPKLSPDGSRIAVQIADSGVSHIHVADIGRGTLSRVTFEGTLNGGPVWAPDGRRLAFFSDRKPGGLNVFTTRSDGGGAIEALTDSPLVTVPSAFSADGALVGAMEMGRDPAKAMDIVLISTQEKKATPFLSTPAVEMVPAFSPDGRWIAYQSDEAGLPQIYVRPYPGPGGKWQISTENGVMPVWTKGGREIVYVSGRGINEFMAVDITVAGDAIVAGKPQKLFELPVVHPPNAWWHDVSPDGARFVVLKSDGPAQSMGHAHFTLMTNFAEQIRRALSAVR